ncbi:MAG: PmoA family protein [Planctomycetota bacterium]
MFRLLVCAVCMLLARSTIGQETVAKQTPGAVSVFSKGTEVLRYNIQAPEPPADVDPIYARSGFLHPVRTPSGVAVTEAYPLDHPHQQGIFSAWVKTTFEGRSVDFWNLAKGSGLVLHDRVVHLFQSDDRAGFEVELIHRSLKPTPVDVLREKWRVTVHDASNDFHCFDLHLVQTALTEKPLTINRYHYGGFAIRGPTAWLTASDRYAKDHADRTGSPSGFVNDLGSKRIEGNHQHSKWVAMWGQVDGKPVSIAVLSHPKNFRAPQPARLHPSKPYFCFAPCVEEAFLIDREHPYAAKYRFLVTDAMPDPPWISEQWSKWVSTSE